MLFVNFGWETAAVLSVVDTVGTGREEVTDRELNPTEGVTRLGG